MEELVGGACREAREAFRKGERLRRQLRPPTAQVRRSALFFAAGVSLGQGRKPPEAPPPTQKLFRSPQVFLNGGVSWDALGKSHPRPQALRPLPHPHAPVCRCVFRPSKWIDGPEVLTF